MGAAPALWIWLILGRNKECVSDFPSSCLGSAVSVHLTQPVILLLSVFRIRKKKNIPLWFCKACKSQKSLNSNLSLKSRVPSAPLQNGCKAQQSLSAFWVAELTAWQFVGENFYIQPPLAGISALHPALPLLGCSSTLNFLLTEVFLNDYCPFLVTNFSWWFHWPCPCVGTPRVIKTLSLYGTFSCQSLFLLPFLLHLLEIMLNTDDWWPSLSSWHGVSHFQDEPWDTS